MGCGKSKQTFSHAQTEKEHESEESFTPKKHFLPRMPSPVEVKRPSEASCVVLDYAHRLSQEIVQDALKQWACNNSKYHDIPYIESDSDAVG
ncbi:small membrane A-kinase anchor protein [Carlito syrichta]|uniref:Small membrane A-kinase anchor protein n=1 Tax=Carlito syrichta TaxID=1868482 RepID=A0A1U7U585_CARSF|nr:small membrane A-kinase anchor protein [Carlito syrichta]